MDMTPVLTQMGTLVFIMAVGFLCTKIGVTGPEFTRSGSKVVLNVLLVFTILDSVTSADMELSLSAVGVDLLAYFALIFISAALGLLCAKLIGGRRDRSGIATFAVAFSNTVFVGFPIWWYVEPRIVDTFLERSDFSGKTVIPFVTHGGGGMARCADEVRKLCPKSTVLKGGAFAGEGIRTTRAALVKWVNETISINK